MSNTNCVSLQELDGFQATPKTGNSVALTTSRTRPVLISSQSSSRTQYSQVPREEALRQAIMRTG